jgi:thiol-disulfide isomerase/thioredoxin
MKRLNGVSGTGRNYAHLFVAGAIVMFIAAAVVIATTEGRIKTALSGKVASSSSLDAALRRLRSEAAAVKFHPTLGPAVGRIESLPAIAALHPTSNDLLAAGSIAPQFSLVTPTGAKVGLSDLRGRVVLLEFSATWCPHCQVEAPHLNHLASLFPASRYSFLAVNGDSEDAASVYAFDRYFGVSFMTLLDQTGVPGNFSRRGGLGQVAASYRVAVFPTFYIVSAAGRITWGSKGEQPDALIEKELFKASGADPVSARGSPGPGAKGAAE